MDESRAPHRGASAATRAALQASLERQRGHVLGIVDGMTDAQLTDSKLPSGWTCIGLVQHLAIDVEHYWFSCIVGGVSLDVFEECGDDATHFWRVDAGVAPSAVLERYRAEIDASNRVIAATELDAPPSQRDEWWGEWSVPDHRFILLHVIAETACHAGHLDAARELTDGRQWITL